MPKVRNHMWCGAGLAGGLTLIAFLFRTVVIAEFGWLEMLIAYSVVFTGRVMPWMEEFAVPMVCVSQVVMFAVLGAWIGYWNAVERRSLSDTLWTVGSITVIVQFFATAVPPQSLLR